MLILTQEAHKVLSTVKTLNAHEQNTTEASLMYFVQLKDATGKPVYFSKFIIPHFTEEKAAALQTKLAADGAKVSVRYDKAGVQESSHLGMLKSAWSDDFDINFDDLSESVYHAISANVEVVSDNKDTWKSVLE